jgi:2-methylisocitrate lyase-like PEP mutase family enzyme
LKSRLKPGDAILAPGVYDAMTALLVEQAGFPAGYLSGASIAYNRFGRPDIGLVAMNEVAEVLSGIAERVELPIIVDGDTGFGNALNVQRTVRLFEQVGAAAIQLEDQTMPKRCGHLTGKALVSASEMVGKLKAALDARRSADTFIIARTDAIAVEGFEAALDRAERYVETGVDVLFVEAPQSMDEMREICRRFGGRIPLLANMVEGGATPIGSAEDLAKLGYSIVIFPGGTTRAVAFLLKEYYGSLKSHGTTAPFRDRMFDLKGLNAVIGTPEMLETGQRYDGTRFDDAAD